MAYKYEIEQKANIVKVRVLIAVYVMFVVSSILIGVALRLQQIKDIPPTAPKADTAGNPALFALSEVSDPIYSANKLKALAYCDVVDANNNPTGVQLPLAAQFEFKQIIRDVGQYNLQLGSVCGSGIGGACSWKNYGDSDEQNVYLCGQTAAQCQASAFACDDNATTGALAFRTVRLPSTAASPVVDWPGGNLVGNLIYDDNEVNVILNLNMEDLASNTITRNGVTYNLLKTQLSTVDTASLFPIYRWRCNNDVCTSTGSCQNGNVTYSSDRCTFDTAQHRFVCPQDKYIRYDVLADNKTYYYSLTQRAGQVTGDPSWVKAGYAYATLVDNTYANGVPADNATFAQAVAFKGNIVKYKFLCRAQTTVTTTPTPTVTPTGSTEISARKTAPVCVERVTPYNEAPFTITVTNGSAATSSTVINSVEDSLPQGFTYKANSTTVNGVLVADSYVTTVNSGASQKVTFAPPAGQTPWTLAPGQTMTITFKALANGSAVTGTNTNHVVVVPEGGNAINNISAQFEVAITCHPDTGVLDEPIFIFIASGVLFGLGLYLLYTPKGSAMLQAFGDATAKVEKSLESETDPKKRFEKRVLKKRTHHGS